MSLVQIREKVNLMWRPLFLGIGLSLFILGAECLVVDEAVLDLPRGNSGIRAASDAISLKQSVSPPEWAPWGLLSAGAVVSIYSMTVARE